MMESLAKEEGKKKVLDCMISELVTIKKNDPLMKCVDLIIKWNMKQLLVLDDYRNIVGIISERDVFNTIAKAMIQREKGES
jgi:predicted transcriptional regulator